MLVAHLCTQSDAVIKQSALSSFIVDIDVRNKDKSLTDLWPEIAKKHIQLPEDDLPEDIRSTIIGINDSTGSAVTALERLATACKTVPITGGVYAYVAHSALSFLYLTQINSTT